MLRDIKNTIHLAILHIITLVVPTAALFIGYKVAALLTEDSHERLFLLIIYVTIIVALKNKN